MTKKKSSYRTVFANIPFEEKQSLDDFIEKLQKIRQFYSPYTDSMIEIGLDYSSCWYEGDQPTVKVAVCGTAKLVEKDEEVA